MDGASQKTSGSASAPKSTGGSRPIHRETEGLGEIPTGTAPDISESSRPSTVTFSREAFERMIRLLKPDLDPALVMAQIEADPAPSTTVQQISQLLHSEIPLSHIEDRGDDWFNIVGETEQQVGNVEIEEPHSGEEDDIGVENDGHLEKGEEVEQQLHEAEEIEENPTGEMNDAMNIVRQVATELESDSTAEIPEVAEGSLAASTEKDTLLEVIDAPCEPY